ncbi:MAG: WD40 repeat domain-containing protein [Candidatus Poribacteria bacterium]|nr:WD40 repeat domain-containing protein [Candidatus Poribacteria bacterium]
MKKGRYCHSIFYFSILVLSLLPISASFAQDNTQVGLPEGAIARLGKGGINVMRFSPDGTRLAVGTDVGVWLYDVEDGKEISLPTGDVRYFNSLAFSTDGKILASCGTLNASIQLWDTETGSKRLSIEVPDRIARVSTLVFTKENKTLTGLGLNLYITEWDVETGEKLEQKSSFLPRRVLAFSQDGKTFVTGHEENGNVRLGYTGSGHEEEIFKEKEQPVVVNPIPELLNDDADEKEVSKGVQAIAYSPDSKTIASAHDDNTVRLWDTATKTERVILKGHTEKIDALAFSHDSTMLASGSFDNTIQLWNVQNGKWRGMLTRHKNSIKALAFSPTEKGLLASGSADGTVRFWDVNTGQERSIFTTEHAESVKALAFTVDNTMLASASSNGTVQIWNLKIGKDIAAPSVASYDSTVGAVFSSDATLFASHGVDTIVESKGSNVPTTLIPHNKTQLWNLPAGDELLTLIGKVNAFAFSPNKKIFATSDANETLLWDVKTGAELFRLEARQFIGDVVVGFSPDGTILATGGAPGETHLWDVKTGEKLATLNTLLDIKSPHL